MTEDVKFEVIKRTQELLGKYFKKPPLTEKLLKKPPFRFLHDIISAVIRETGFLEGLFSEEELISDNIKDKEAKLAYLTKLIDVVKLISGSNLTVRASKIIAGHEPTKTNELLQAIGKSLDKKLNSAEAIEVYKKNDDKKTRSTGRTRLPSKEESVRKPASRQSSQTRRSSEKEKSLPEQKKRSTSTGKVSIRGSKVHNEEKQDRKHVQGKDKLAKQAEQIIDIPPAEPFESRQFSSAQSKKHPPPVKRKDVTSPKTSEPQQTKTAQLDSTDSPAQKRKESSSQNRKESATNREKQLSSNQQSESSTQKDKRIEITSSEKLKSASIEKNSNSEPSKKDKERSKRSTESTKLSSSHKSVKVDRIPSAATKESTLENPGSPPLQLLGNVSDAAEITASTEESTVLRPKTSLRPPSVRPVSARPAAPRMRSKTELIVNENIPTSMGNVNVIVENFDARDDDADDMVVIKTDDNDSLGIIGSNGTESQLTYEHGHLVAQILETQRELVNTDNIDVMPKKVEIEWEAGLKRERETIVKEVDKLRGAIQTLTRATNPLGKLLDYLQEDVEIMQKELQDWRNQYNQLSEQLEKERIQTEEEIQPMKETLKDIENRIQVQFDEIFQVKSNMLKNDRKIQKFLNEQL